MNVFLDDVRACPKGFRLARTAEQCMKLLETCKIEVLSLDHDLGYQKPTGYDVAKFMVRNKLFAPKIIIHSANPIGSIRMFLLLNKHKPEHVRIDVQPRPYRLSAK